MLTSIAKTRYAFLHKFNNNKAKLLVYHCSRCYLFCFIAVLQHGQSPMVLAVANVHSKAVARLKEQIVCFVLLRPILVFEMLTCDCVCVCMYV